MGFSVLSVKFMKHSYRHDGSVLDIERFSSSGIWIVSSGAEEVKYSFFIIRFMARVPRKVSECSYRHSI